MSRRLPSCSNTYTLHACGRHVCHMKLVLLFLQMAWQPHRSLPSCWPCPQCLLCSLCTCSFAASISPHITPCHSYRQLQTIYMAILHTPWIGDLSFTSAHKLLSNNQPDQRCGCHEYLLLPLEHHIQVLLNSLWPMSQVHAAVT